MALREILRLTPWSVRRRIFERVAAQVTAERRLRIAGVLLPLGSGRVRRADGAVLRVRTPSGVVRARVDARATPAGVRRRNLDRVVRALDESGADWFRVPADDPLRTAVAVRETDRSTVLPLLRRLTANDHGSLRSRPPATDHGPLRSRPPATDHGPLPSRASTTDHGPLQDHPTAPGHGWLRRRRAPGAVSVCWPVTDPGGDLVLGHDLACEVEFWRERGGRLVEPYGGPLAGSIRAGEPSAVAAEPAFGPFCAPDDATGYRTRAIFATDRPDRIGFDIDVVCTGATGLRHTLRSLHCFAPWVRRVFLITDTPPDWLDLAYPRLTVAGGVTRPHLIPGLAEHFLHFGDGVLLGRPVTPGLFFTPDGLPRFFPPADGPAADIEADGPAADSRRTGIEAGGPAADSRRTGIEAAGPAADSRRTDIEAGGPAAGTGKSGPTTDGTARSATENDRRLIGEAFGRALTRELPPVPHPARRSVLAEFGHPDGAGAALHPYLTGRAASGDIRHRTADPDPLGLALLLRRRDADALNLAESRLTGAFLAAYLPFVSPFELQHRNTRAIAAPRRPGDRPVPPDVALPPVA